MSTIKSLLAELSRQSVEGEDGDERRLELNPPATPAQIAGEEGEAGAALPVAYREFLAFGNGGYFFGEELFGTENENWLSDGLAIMYSWGNGDFDCVVVRDGKHPKGSVVFANHNPQTTVLIALSLEDWFRGAFEEIRQHGGLGHPMDYRTGARSEGMYSHVLDELAGVDCELNR